jgi:uncharacterized membrane protein YdbT with pleckstrin-like domain
MRNKSAGSLVYRIVGWTAFIAFLGALANYFLGVWLVLGRSNAMIGLEEEAISEADYERQVALLDAVTRLIPVIVLLFVLVWMIGLTVMMRRHTASS